MHQCVCSHHPISPLIILQSSNLSLYSMFSLLHCAITMTRDKQCACWIRSKQDLYVYTLCANLDQVLHTVVLPGLTRLNSEGARLNC